MKIDLKTSASGAGNHDYPAFNQLPAVKRAGMDWAKYIDVYGGGWHYDHVSGHKDDAPESPHGFHFGVMCVPEDFADEAVAAFPESVIRLTEVEMADFYDTRSHIHDPEESNSANILQAIYAKRQLGLAESPTDIKALDPDDPTPGIVKNKNKTWAGHKIERGIKFKENP